MHPPWRVWLVGTSCTRYATCCALRVARVAQLASGHPQICCTAHGAHDHVVGPLVRLPATCWQQRLQYRRRHARGSGRYQTPAVVRHARRTAAAGVWCWLLGAGCWVHSAPTGRSRTRPRVACPAPCVIRRARGRGSTGLLESARSRRRNAPRATCHAPGATSNEQRATITVSGAPWARALPALIAVWRAPFAPHTRRTRHSTPLCTPSRRLWPQRSCRASPSRCVPALFLDKGRQR